MKIKKMTAVLLGLCGAFAFAACDDEPATTGNSHTHTWNAGEITTPATKDQDGVKTFTCNDCGETKTEAVEYVADTEVTAEEWATAMALSADNYTGNFTATMGEESQRVIMKKAGNAFSKTAGWLSDGEMTEADEHYYAKDGDTYYHYWLEDEQWYKGEMPQDEYESAMSNSIIQGWDFSSFTYNAQTKVYEMASGTLNTWQIQNAIVSFEDGLLTDLKFTRVLADENVEYWFAYTYGDAEITLPQVVEKVEDTEVTAVEWTTALALEYDNYTLQSTMKQAENIISEVLTQYSDGLLYQNADGEETYFQNDNGNYYQYLQEDDEWHKYKSSEEDYNKRVKPNLIGNFSYDEFAYNAETEKYETSSIESSVIHFTYVSFSFLDNKVQSLTFMIQEERGVVYNYNFSYGDAEITLPQTVPSKKIKSDDMLASAFSAAFAMQENCEYAVGMDSLKNMTYIEAGGYYTYTAVYDKELNLQADYQAYFLDGKLVKLEVFIDGVKTYVFTYDYEVEEIQIPEV